MNDDPDPLELVLAEIRAQLGRRNITRRELARQLGQPHNWVSRRLCGDVTLTVRDLYRISGVLGVHPSVLLPTDR